MKSNVIILISISFIFFSAQSQTIEDFTNISIPTSYSSGTFIGKDSIMWHYSNARGGQTTNTNKNSAISLNKAITACIYSDTLPLGLSKIQFQWEQELTAGCNASVYVNDSCIAILQSTNKTDSTQICSIDSIFFNMPVVFKIVQNASNSGQITIDDIQLQYARNPYFPLQIGIISDNDSVLHFNLSKPLLHFSVYTIPSNIITEYSCENTIVIVHCNQSYCGNYSLIFTDLVDLDSISESDFQFEFHKTIYPEWQSILVSEIMADPSPNVKLPEIEFLEIYNNTDCDIRAKDIQIYINTNTIVLPDSILKPHSYYTIAESCIGIPNHCIIVTDLPALINEGTSITILNSNNTIISSIEYSDSWYSSNFKKNGGWSLEKIDINNFSESKSNWSASIDETGGTPGKTNSIGMHNADTIPPQLLELYPINDSIIRIRISENCNPYHVAEFFNNSTFTILKTTAIDYSLSYFEIEIFPKLEKNKQYTFEIRLHDIEGNQSNPITYSIGLPETIIQKNSIQFNELLYNPLPGKYDFIELYNNSENYINCSQLYIAGYDDTNTDYSPIIQLTDKAILLAPHGFIIISESLQDIFSYTFCTEDVQFFELAELPPLPDDKGILVLLNSLGEIIDSISYNNNWHAPNIGETEGISLERISHDLPTQYPQNWYSCSTINQTATPGCENTQSNTEAITDFEINSDVITPNNDGDNDLLEISCNSNDGKLIQSVYIFTLNGELIKEICNSDVSGNTNTLVWNCTDLNNKLVNSGIYILLLELRNSQKIKIKKRKLITVIF